MAHHLPLMLVALLGCLVGLGSSDLAADRAECSDKLIGLATCLPFVGGEAKSPTPDCCTGYKEVTAKSIKCLCILIKDRDDPSLGLKINVSLAITLPRKCNAPINISTCSSLLKLPPDSKYAKEFQLFESELEGKNSSSSAKMNSTATGGAAGAQASDGRRERFMRMDIFSLMFALLVPFFSFKYVN